MPRALRIEYPGACYHVMCRGNQRQAIFRTPADADLFLRTLGQVCVRNEIRVHAYCLMTNHYHLLLETPLGNLVDAMKWLQGTFTQRYNNTRRKCGHLFQGRYKAKIIDDTDWSYFQKVSEYIHLNPAEAGKAEPGQLARYPWSSYQDFLRTPTQRPSWLVAGDVLETYHLRDTKSGRSAYAALLNDLHRELEGNTKQFKKDWEWKKMARGWVHGDEEFRDKMLEHLKDRDIPIASVMDQDQKRDISVASAKAVLHKCLTHYGWTNKDLSRIAKSDPRKLLMAGLLRYHFPVSTTWVSEQLRMGHFTTVSRAMRFYDHPEGKWKEEKKQILRFIG